MPEVHSMTEGQIARTALAVQDACNLSGVVHSWSACLHALWDVARAREVGTHWVNSHPACVLFASKVADLTGYGHPADSDSFSRAYTACIVLSKEE